LSHRSGPFQAASWIGTVGLGPCSKGPLARLPLASSELEGLEREEFMYVHFRRQRVVSAGPRPKDQIIEEARTWELAGVMSLCASIGLGIRSIRVIRFCLFGFLKSRVMKNENRNFQNNFRNRTRINPQFRFGLFGPPNRLE
jgi:hypothetical protein